MHPANVTTGVVRNSPRQSLETNAIVDEVSHFYREEDQSHGTHLALRWNGRLRYTIPRADDAQAACWKLFRPGRLGVPLRAVARFPHLLGAVSCVESGKLAVIRQAIGKEAGLSCCRTGTPGVWSKDTILLFDKKTAAPLYIIKAGMGEAVDLLLRNEANWLKSLRDQAPLADHIPELVTHRTGADLAFVVQCVVSGGSDYALGEPQFGFLRKLHAYSLQPMRYEDSRLYRTFESRVKDLSGLLPETWLSRLDLAIRRINESLAGQPVLLVAAHNDFAPWNVRVQHNVAYVFDWEYAAHEQLPLFDPLHFVLMPMALKSAQPVRIIRYMHETLQLCRQWFGEARCYKAEIQALAYCVNLCTLYLWADRGQSTAHPALASYAQIIDYICRAS